MGVSGPCGVSRQWRWGDAPSFRYGEDVHSKKTVSRGAKLRMRQQKRDHAEDQDHQRSPIPIL